MNSEIELNIDRQFKPPLERPRWLPREEDAYLATRPANEPARAPQPRDDLNRPRVLVTERPGVRPTVPPVILRDPQELACTLSWEVTNAQNQEVPEPEPLPRAEPAEPEEE